MQSRSILNHTNVLKSSDVKAADSLIQLAIDNSSLTKDIGFIGEYGPTGGQQAYAGAFFDRSDSMKYKIFSGITGPTGVSNSNILFDTDDYLADVAIGSLSSSNLTSGLVPYTDSSQTLRNMTGVYWDSTNQILGFGTVNPTGANLVIKNTNKPQIKLEFSSVYYSTISNESTTGLVITTNGPTWLSDLNNGDYFRFASNGTNDYIQSVNGNMFLSGINGANSTKCIILSDNMGININTPSNGRLEVRDSTNAQLNLSNDDMNYTTFETNSSGNLQITPSGTTTYINSGIVANGSSSTAVNIVNNSTTVGGMFTTGTSSILHVGTIAASSIYLVVGNSTKMYINNNGNVCIGNGTVSQNVARLQLVDTAKQQLQLVGDGSLTCDFEVDSNGYLEITPNGYKTTLINSATGPELVLKCSTSQTNLDAKLGGIVFANNSLEQAAIRSHIDIGGANNNADLRFYTTSDFVNVDLERMRIDRAGLLGVNETNPTNARCHITDWTQAQLKLEGTGSNYSTFTHQSDNTLLLSVAGEATGCQFYGPTGVKMPFGDTWLNWYEESTESIDFSGIWASDITVSIRCVRIGNQVTITIPDFKSATNSANLIFSTAALPADFRGPVGKTISQLINVYDEGAMVQGHLEYYNGNFSIYVGISSSFNLGATNSSCGLNQQVTISFSI